MTIFDRIKTAADEQKKSIMAIEKEAGVANGTISKWDKSKPRINTLAKVARVLGISIDELIEESK